MYWISASSPSTGFSSGIAASAVRHAANAMTTGQPAVAGRSIGIGLAVARSQREERRRARDQLVGLPEHLPYDVRLLFELLELKVEDPHRVSAVLVLGLVAH